LNRLEFSRKGAMRVLVTAGPTREYLDDVRYLSNASRGRMGYAIAQAALDAGWEVVLVSGPVPLSPPVGCEFHSVETTAQMRDAAVRLFPPCDGVIAAAAVCDYKPRERVSGKLSKTGGPVTIEMIETDDVLAELGASKEHRWVLGFALEARNPRENALQKLRRKNCDWILLNSPSAIGAETNQVELINPDGLTEQSWSGTKTEVAGNLVDWLRVEGLGLRGQGKGDRGDGAPGGNNDR
jgi:phosphopantothenoylcysteine decarboxylase / phosphopantothenate---cysteine ligase